MVYFAASQQMCWVLLQMNFAGFGQHNSTVVFLNPNFDVKLFWRGQIDSQIEWWWTKRVVFIQLINCGQILLVVKPFRLTQVLVYVIRQRFPALPGDSVEPVHSSRSKYSVILVLTSMRVDISSFDSSNAALLTNCLRSSHLLGQSQGHLNLIRSRGTYLSCWVRD